MHLCLTLRATNMAIQEEIVKSSPNSYLVDIEIHAAIVQDRDKEAKPKGIFLNTSAVYHIGRKGNKQTGTQQTMKQQEKEKSLQFMSWLCVFKIVIQGFNCFNFSWF